MITRRFAAGTLKGGTTMNDLRLETMYALNEAAGIVAEVNDGKVTRMYIEGGNDNE